MQDHQHKHLSQHAQGGVTGINRVGRSSRSLPSLNQLCNPDTTFFSLPTFRSHRTRPKGHSALPGLYVRASHSPKGTPDFWNHPVVLSGESLAGISQQGVLTRESEAGAISQQNSSPHSHKMRQQPESPTNTMAASLSTSLSNNAFAMDGHS